MKLRYTAFAFREIGSILDYVGERNPQGARRVQERIKKITALLLVHPYAGKLTSRRGMRVIVASPFPYMIAYRVQDDEIVIYDVRHTARKPQP